MTWMLLILSTVSSHLQPYCWFISRYSRQWQLLLLTLPPSDRKKYRSMIESSYFPLITNQGTGLSMPTINITLKYICEMIYRIPQFTTHTRVNNSLNKHLRHAGDLHCYVESPHIPQSPVSFDQVTRLPPKNASAPLGHPDARWPTISISQVSYIQYLFACQKSQRNMPCIIVKRGLAWSRDFLPSPS